MKPSGWTASTTPASKASPPRPPGHPGPGNRIQSRRGLRQRQTLARRELRRLRRSRSGPPSSSSSDPPPNATSAPPSPPNFRTRITSPARPPFANSSPSPPSAGSSSPMTRARCTSPPPSASPRSPSSAPPMTPPPAPPGPLARVVREHAECAPCLLRECPIDHRCMTRVTPERVAAVARELLEHTEACDRAC